MRKINRQRVAWITGILCILLADVSVPRSIQVLMVRNDGDLPLSNVQVRVQSKAIALKALRPGESDFIWVLLPGPESTFQVAARWADGTTQEFDACYLTGVPVVYRVTLKRAQGEPRCDAIAPAPFGLGVVYARLVTWFPRT